MQTEFVRSLNCNYERILLDEKPEEKRYQYCILSRGGIKGLLSCSLRYINGLAYLYYDISSKQNIMQLYSGRCITREWVRDFIWSLGQIRQELNRFLLDTGNVLFYPEQLFQDLESNVFSFVYIPYYQGENGFKQLLEFWVEHIDYEDEVLVNCVYHMYEQLEQNGEVYLQARIFEDAEMLNRPATMPESAFREEVEGTNQEPLEDKKEEKRWVDVKQARECADIAEAEQKKGFFGIFENRKKRSREQRESYRQDMREIMEGRAVAEETVYEADYGRTIYIEEAEAPGEPKGLYTSGGKALTVIDKPVVTIGKRKGEADVVLQDMSVSRLHARIVKEKESCYIEDLNSTNGTFKNGLRLQPYEKRELEEGDEIKVGRVALVFR